MYFKFIKFFKKKRLIKIIYCPPNTLIDLMSKKLKNTNIDVGSQNCHEKEDYGPYTGSVSCSMLKKSGFLSGKKIILKKRKILTFGKGF